MPEHAVVIHVAELAWTAGAPAPVVMASEQRTLFSFDAPATEEFDRRVAEFVGCTSFRFGFPNDEALGGHPLYGSGLSFYAAHEVIESRWLEEIRGVEAHHPQAAPTPFADARHFVLTFHDSTLEAIAREVRVVASFASEAEADMAMLANLREG